MKSFFLFLIVVGVFIVALPATVPTPVPIFAKPNQPFYTSCIVVFDVKKGQTLQQVIDSGNVYYQDCER